MKAAARYLGFIEFYDWQKQFGFIGTNQKGLPHADGEAAALQGIFFHYSSWDDDGLPADSMWVTFTQREDARGAKAKDVRRFGKSAADIQLLLEYSEAYATIDGWDPKHTIHYVKHIFSDIIVYLFTKKATNDTLKNFLCVLFAQIKNKEWFLTQILENNECAAIVKRLILNEAEEGISDTQRMFRDAIIGNDIKSGKISWQELSTLVSQQSDGLWLRAVSVQKLDADARTKAAEVRAFLQAIGPAGAATLFAACSPAAVGWELAKRLWEAYGQEMTTVFVGTEALPETFSLLLGAGGKLTSLAHVKDWTALASTLEAEPAITLQLLRHCLAAAMTEMLEQCPVTAWAKALQQAPPAEQHSLLESLAEANANLAMAIAQHLPVGEVVEDFRKHLWEQSRAELPYMVFDVETDGQTIREFAFRQDGETRTYQGEEQLAALLRRCANPDIILVGHNIRQWDLPLLQQRGLKTTAFVWDTLEIELLLNPCRSAYSLLTTHTAQADAELTERLFWNQLCRLADAPDVCQAMRSFLPSNVPVLLERLQQPFFAPLVRKIRQEKGFFKDMLPLDDGLEKQLRTLEDTADQEKTLIIAPMALWPQLAQYLSLRFPSMPASDAPRFRVISRQKLAAFPCVHPLGQAVLQRFCAVRRTPALACLPGYVRTGDPDSGKVVFTDVALEAWLEESDGSLDCVAWDALEDAAPWCKGYQRVCRIGGDMYDRWHKVSVGSPWTFKELMALSNALPFKMDAANCLGLDKQAIALFAAKARTDEERHAWNRARQEDTANIWLERGQGESYTVFKNYIYTRYYEKFLRRLPQSVHDTALAWKYRAQKGATGPVMVTCARGKNFDNTAVRVDAGTAYRGRYWAAQLGLCCHIQARHPDLPVVFVVDTLEQDELLALREYAASLGFTLPEGEAGHETLEWAFRHPRSLLLETREHFGRAFGVYRADRPFCVIWDNLGIARLRRIWKRLPVPLPDAVQDASDVTAREEARYQTTARECVQAVWPLLEQYCAMVMANHPDCRFYVLDPCFDDDPGLAAQVGAKTEAIVLWNSQAAWHKDCATAQGFFAKWRVDREYVPLDTEARVKFAKKIIWKMLIHPDRDMAWSKEQEDVLAHMLHKQGDCVVSMPTGAGKSVCFQGPALYRSYFTKKLTLWSRRCVP